MTSQTSFDQTEKRPAYYVVNSVTGENKNTGCHYIYDYCEETLFDLYEEVIIREINGGELGNEQYWLKCWKTSDEFWEGERPAFEGYIYLARI